MSDNIGCVYNMLRFCYVYFVWCQSIPGSLTQTVQCRGMEGRFINLLKSCDAAYLTFCEVKVYGGRNPIHHKMSSKGG